MELFLQRRLLLLAFFVACCAIKESSAKKILVVEFFGSKSHVITYLQLIEELARRGHEVTIIGPGHSLVKEKSIRSYLTFNVDGLFKDDDTKDVYKMKETGEGEGNPFIFLTEMAEKSCNETYSKPEIMALLDETFDLVILQPLFNDCAMGFVHRFIEKGAHLVLFTPTSAPYFLVRLLGGYQPASFVPSLFLNYNDNMTFSQRMVNFGFNLLVDLTFDYYYLPVVEGLYRENVGQDVPGSKEILSKASIMLANGHFSLNRPKPNLPDVIDVGGIHSNKAAKPLPKDLEKFINKSGEHGFIFFSLGSGIRSDMMPKEKKQMFVNVLSRLKQQVIWKYESDDFPNLPPNVMISKWLPQQDILGHPKIRLFISHCGAGGLSEAIFNSVPVLGLPFFGDQPLNAQQAEKQGFLLQMDFNHLTEQKLMDTIQEMLTNPRYKNNVERLSSIFLDQPDNPLDRGIYWVEYVMRHNGAPHLRSPARDLNTIQYHCLDVIATYVAIISFIVYIFAKTVGSLLSLVFGKGKQPGLGSLSNGKKVN